MGEGAVTWVGTVFGFIGITYHTPFYGLRPEEAVKEGGRKKVGDGRRTK